LTPGRLTDWNDRYKEDQRIKSELVAGAEGKFVAIVGDELD
jgi:hypothetical protein